MQEVSASILSQCSLCIYIQFLSLAILIRVIVAQGDGRGGLSVTCLSVVFFMCPLVPEGHTSYHIQEERDSDF